MCRDTTKEDLLFRFMKTYSVKEAMALKTLNEYHIEITRANNKRKRVHRKERKQRLLEEKEYQAYKEDVCLRFMETGQVYTLEEYAIIKEEFFQRRRECSLNEYMWK